MSERIICQGCGQRIELPEGYRRNKIQCPECGVITAVNLAGRKPVPSAPGPGGTDDTPFETDRGPSQGNLLPPRLPVEEPDIAALPVPEPPRPAAGRREARPREEGPGPEQPRAEPAVWTCQHCGEWQPRKPRGKKPVCPVCKTPVPAEPRRDAVTATVLQKLLPRTAAQPAEWSEDPEDSKPYRVDATGPLGCPGCGKPMEPQAILCLHCGLDLRSGSKAKTLYDPITRRWDAGLPLPLRWLCFGGWQCVALPPVLWGAAHEGHAFYAVGSWLWLSVLVAFLVGTYDRLDLHRNARGKVRLLKTWYFCFVPRKPETVDLVQYEGILTGQVHAVDIADYVVLASFACFAILAVFAAGVVAGLFALLPGIVWYFTVMQRDTFFVALTKDHGHPELLLFRSWSEPRAKEVATTLRTAALPEYEWY